jgi:hypothetical protein
MLKLFRLHPHLYLVNLEDLRALRTDLDRDGFLFWPDEGWDRYGFTAGYHTTFHLPHDVRERWARWFEIVEVACDGTRPRQDLVILRR